MNDPNDPVAQRAAAIEAEGRATHGEENWQRAMKGIGEQLKSGALDQTELVQKMGKADAAGRLFMDGIAASSESDWRAWRDAQPRRKARIDRCK